MKRKNAVPMPTIIQAMEDPRLFGAFYQGPTWDPWKACLKAAFGLEMTEEETAFFKMVAGDRDPSCRRVRELVIAAGRRAGKDAISALVGAYMVLTFKPDGRVRAGERPLILLLAADRSQARNLLRYIRGLFEVPALKALITRETQDGFELRNGCDISVGTGDYRTVRGRTILCCIMNEVAFWQDAETAANPSGEIYRAIKPSLASLADQAMLIMISSVHRRSGLLYEKWAKHFGQNDPNTLVVTGGTRQFNPTIDQQVVDDALADDVQSASAEYLSQWRDDLASYITRTEIEACVDGGIAVRPRQTGIEYQSWIDASSGAGKDSMCCSVGHRVDDVTFVIDCIVEIKPPFSPPDACSSIASTLKSYGITRTTGDRWGLNFVAAEFQRHGITLEYSDKHRSDVYREALPLLTSKRARLIDNERMIGQFANLERRAMSGGREVIDHPQRGAHHDDVSLVVAGCLVALATPITGAEAFIEHYRRMVEEPWRFQHNTDFDRVRPTGPDFGFNFGTQQIADLVRVTIPPDVWPSTLIGASGQSYLVGAAPNGERFVMMSPDDAKALVCSPMMSSSWREMNPNL